MTGVMTTSLPLAADLDEVVGNLGGTTSRMTMAALMSAVAAAGAAPVFAQRADALGASLSATTKVLFIGGLGFIADPAGTALVKGALRFSPLGEPTVRHWGAGAGGADDSAAFAAACAWCNGGSLHIPDGEYYLTSAPPNLQTVVLTGSPRVQFTGPVKLPVAGPIFTGNRRVALVAFVLRYYATEGKWKTLFDGGEGHDPLLSGPVSASGSTSLILDVGLNTYGIDPARWAPSGCVIGCDETLASFGAPGFGGSVEGTKITIKGGHSTPWSGLIYYNGSTWTGSNNPYDLAFAAGNLTLTRKPQFKRAGYKDGSIHPSISNVSKSGQTAWYDTRLIPGDNDSFTIEFRNPASAMAKATVADANMIFGFSDPMMVGNPFRFDVAPPDGANIWGMAAYVDRTM